jgi:hypothetical protein
MAPIVLQVRRHHPIPSMRVARCHDGSTKLHVAGPLFAPAERDQLDALAGGVRWFNPRPGGVRMGWLKRWWNRMRNLSSAGDYPGGHGGGSGGSTSQEFARMETIARRDMPGPTSS